MAVAVAVVVVVVVAVVVVNVVVVMVETRATIATRALWWTIGTGQTCNLACGPGLR